MAENKEPDESSSIAGSKVKKSIAEQLTLAVGVISTLITVSLTIWNAHTKSQIDAAEQNLKREAQKLEASREKVARYTWVRGLFDDLVAKEETKRNFTVSLINGSDTFLSSASRKLLLLQAGLN